MKRMSSLCFPVIALVMSLNLLSCGSDGESAATLLDALFGMGGKVTTAIGTADNISSLQIQSDGKLVAAGYSFDDILGRYVFALVRYNSDGTLDTDFDSDGIVTTPIGTVDDKAYALVIQPLDQKLVVAGYSDNGSQRVFALVRYNSDGTLDTTFNPTGPLPGAVTTAVGTDEDTAYALAIQPDNRLVAAGYSYNGTTGAFEFALVRYNTDGSLDTAGFGTGGMMTTAIGSDEDIVYSLAIQSDNKLVAAGYSDDGSQFKFALVRYNTDGSLDTAGFGAGGIVITAVGGFDAANAVAVQPSDERLVAAGYSYNIATGGYEFTLVRYNTDGSLDTAFNPTGVLPGAVTTTFGAFDDTVNALAIQPDGKLVAAGYTADISGTEYQFALARYGTDGTLDTTFNMTGKIVTAVGGDDAANAVLIQSSDNKIVAAGYSLQGSQYEFAVVRYMPIP